MEKKTDGGHEIPEEDLREMEQDGGQEVAREPKHKRDIVNFADSPGLFTHRKHGARKR